MTGRQLGGASGATAERPDEGARSAFWRYWTASAVSTTGTGVTTVALPLLALLTLDASNFEVGLLTAASYAGVVVIGLPAGVIVQRYSLRSLQVSMDLARAIALATVPLAALWEVLTLGHLLLVAVLVGMAGTIFDVGNATFLPRIVPQEQLTKRNGQISGTQAVTTMAGPALGGALVQALGAATLMVINVVSYLVSAAMLGSIRTQGTPAQPDRAPEPIVAQITEGLRYVLAHPVLRPAVLAASAVNFANGAVLAALPPYLVRTLGLSPGAVGLVLAVDGLGTVAGAMLTARWVARYGDARVLLVAPLVGAVLSLAMPLSMGLAAVPLFCLGIAGMAAGIAVLSVITRTHRQTIPPPRLLARVMASVRFVSWSAAPIGALLAGALAEGWGPRASLVLVSVAAGLAFAILFGSRVRSLRNLADAEPSTAR